MGQGVLTSFTAIAGLLASAAALNSRMSALEGAWVEAPATQLEKWSPRLVEAFSFGHVPVAVDWLWMRSLQDPAISHVAPGSHPPAFYDLDLATDLDPAFYEVYSAGANLLSVVRNDGPGARDLLEKGIRFRDGVLGRYPASFRDRYWRNSWNLSILLAYVYLFELDDMVKAAEAFQSAAAISGAPAYVGRLAERLSKPGGQYEVGLRLLTFMISGQNDPRVADGLEKKREALYLSQFLFHLNLEFNEYLKKSQQGDRNLEQHLKRFLKESGQPDRDPWGGTFRLDAEGRIRSTTPSVRVFGLE